MNSFIIAEAGVNHNGSRELALELVRVAKEAGADAVKFQTFRADDVVKIGTNPAEYQKLNSSEKDQHALLKRLELSLADHEAIIGECNKAGIEFMSTAFDENSLSELVGMGISRLKIPSGEITNIPFIHLHAEVGLPIILSTGMSYLEEVGRAVDIIRNTWARIGKEEELGEALTILHCTSDYPASMESVNLNALRPLADYTGCRVGYSDHTTGIEVSIAAVALGATIIEKHFTLDRTMPGPDHSASLEPEEWKRMVDAIRNVEKSMGTGDKRPDQSELQNRDLVRRSLFTKRQLKKGHRLAVGDLRALRPGNGISPADLEQVAGKELKRDMDAGVMIAWSDLS